MGGLLPNRLTGEHWMADSAIVSVVICAYTMERWPSLRSGIEGAIAQEPAPVEVIVVVDTDELVQRLRSEWPDSSARIRAIRNEGIGINGARNTGLREAKAEIVLFLDDDGPRLRSPSGSNAW